jgi:hypothetical protein
MRSRSTSRLITSAANDLLFIGTRVSTTPGYLAHGWLPTRGFPGRDGTFRMRIW